MSMFNKVPGSDLSDKVPGNYGVVGKYLPIVTLAATSLFAACKGDDSKQTTNIPQEKSAVVTPFIDGPTGSSFGIRDTTTDSKQHSPIKGLSVSQAAQKLESDKLYMREEGQSDEEFVAAYEAARQNSQSFVTGTGY